MALHMPPIGTANRGCCTVWLDVLFPLQLCETLTEDFAAPRVMADMTELGGRKRSGIWYPRLLIEPEA